MRPRPIIPSCIRRSLRHRVGIAVAGAQNKTPKPLEAAGGVSSDELVAPLGYSCARGKRQGGTAKVTPVLVDTRIALLFLHYVVAEDKAYFAKYAELVVIREIGTGYKTWRKAACMNPGNVSANEEASSLKGGCRG